MSVKNCVALLVMSVVFSQVNLSSQTVLEEPEPEVGQPQPLEYVIIDGEVRGVVPYDQVTVDGMQNAARIFPGNYCGGEWVEITDIPEGLWVIAISGGPGISYTFNAPYDVGCYLLYTVPDGHEAYGLHGYGDPSRIRSWKKYQVPSGPPGKIRLYIVDKDCSDNSGYVEVTLYQIL